MKRILSLTLGFAALSLIGCPPPAMPTPEGTGSAAGTGTGVITETIEETVKIVEEVITPAEEPAAPAEEAPAVEEPAAPAEEAPAAETPVEKAAETVKNVAEKAVDATKATAEKAAVATEKAIEKTEEAVEKAVDTVKKDLGITPAAPAEEAPAAPAKEETPAAPAEEAPAAPAEEAPAAPAEEAPAAPAEETPAAPAVEETVVEEAVIEEATAPAEDAPAAEESAAPAEAAPAKEEPAAPAEAAPAEAASRANPPQPKVELNPAFKPAIYATLPDYCPVPDGMTLDEKTNIIYLNCPNYVPADANGKREFNACLMQILPDGTVEKILEYPNHPETGKIGSMGIDICPAGNLYVSDNQRFSTDPQGQVASRILRIARDENGKVIFDENGKPDIRVVIEGINLANAIMWDGGDLYVTDTIVPTQEGDFGRGGIWKFTGEEIKKAVENNEVIKVDAKAGDAHLFVTAPVKKIGREDFSGADGMTKAWGAIYFGNFGDGVIRKVTLDAEGKPVVEVVVDRDDFQCCDGIFYDAVTDLIYIDDSQANAIRTLDKDGNLNILWINPDTDGADGSLDQPAECIVRDGKLIMANFDWTFPGLTNSAHDKPYTLSVIDISSLAKTTTEKVVEAVEATAKEAAETAENIAEKAVDATKAAAEKTVEAVDATAEKAADVAEKALEKTGEAVEKAVDAAEKALGIAPAEEAPAAPATPAAPVE